MAKKTKTNWIEMGDGDDFIVGTRNADIVVVREGDGIDTISGFDPYGGDRVLFDIYGQWSDVMFLGRLYDGQVIETARGTFLVEGGDFDNDGATDTRITAGDDGVIVLGWAPDDMFGWMLQGG